MQQQKVACRRPSFSVPLRPRRRLSRSRRASRGLELIFHIAQAQAQGSLPPKPRRRSSKTTTRAQLPPTPPPTPADTSTTEFIFPTPVQPSSPNDNTDKMMSQIPGEIPPPNLAALAEDHYFSANPPPKDLEKHVKMAKDFIDFHANEGRRLVLITSGGTTVPLGEFFPLFLLVERGRW